MRMKGPDTFFWSNPLTVVTRIIEKSRITYSMNKPRLFGAISACLLTLAMHSVSAAVIPFEIIDVYSSVNIQYEFTDGSDSDSYYDEVHGSLSSSLSHAFDLGPLSGS